MTSHEMATLSDLGLFLRLHTDNDDTESRLYLAGINIWRDLSIDIVGH